LLKDHIITSCSLGALQCSDIDGTMVSDSGDTEEKFWGLSRTQEFQDYWENVAALTSGVLVYNTGRSKGQLVHLLGEKEMLAVPDVCITAVGTKVKRGRVKSTVQDSQHGAVVHNVVLFGVPSCH
jgi:hypothetical protein